ncbi:PREDICTED: coiled-coil domain-containing protein 68 [Fulmarus glacialis]|uniref:coiled-coil domain-containing protein 68 n=1 Tax=Fulmarus glacialis TaxID=30455 RepID=UPI00051BF869|nr:PREDICTED: coiled-coil domain-containing protein 68 [Fulmarus glacialis]
MTTLLLTEQVTREDRGSEGNYVLYGSSCAQITEEAEYVKKLPQVSGNRVESRNSGWSCSPVARTMKETEEQLLLVSRENQVLKIKLEATREAGVQALRSASQKLYKNYQTRSEELKKSHENEKKEIQAYRLQQEEKLQQSSEHASRLAEGIGEKCTRIAEMEKRLQRMEEKNATVSIRNPGQANDCCSNRTAACTETRRKIVLLYREFSSVVLVALEEAMAPCIVFLMCLDLQKQISTLQEQICHLQRVIQAQHHSLRSVIQEAEELNNELRSQDKKIENLTEKLTALEAQNKELKDRVEFWSGQPKTKVSKAVWTDAPRDFGAFGASRYLMLARLRKQES